MGEMWFLEDLNYSKLEELKYYCYYLTLVLLICYLKDKVFQCYDFFLTQIAKLDY